MRQRALSKNMTRLQDHIKAKVEEALLSKPLDTCFCIKLVSCQATKIDKSKKLFDPSNVEVVRYFGDGMLDQKMVRDHLDRTIFRGVKTEWVSTAAFTNAMLTVIQPWEVRLVLPDIDFESIFNEVIE